MTVAECFLRGVWDGGQRRGVWLIGRSGLVGAGVGGGIPLTASGSYNGAIFRTLGQGMDPTGAEGWGRGIALPIGSGARLLRALEHLFILHICREGVDHIGCMCVVIACIWLLCNVFI